MKTYRKAVLVAVTMFACMCLTGCATSIVELNEEETKAVARYMADTLLQHDTNYKKAELIYKEPEQQETEEPVVTEAPVSAATPTPEPEASASNDAIVKADTVTDSSGEEDTIIEWDRFFTTDKWKITYSSYNTYKTYPEKSDLYAINAKEGNELLVLFFDIENLTDKKVKVNLINSKLKYKLHIGNDEYEPQIAVLENGGLMYLRTSIPAGKTGKTELVFEVPEGIELTDMRLDVIK